MPWSGVSRAGYTRRDEGAIGRRPTRRRTPRRSGRCASTGVAGTRWPSGDPPGFARLARSRKFPWGGARSLPTTGHPRSPTKSSRRRAPRKPAEARAATSGSTPSPTATPNAARAFRRLCLPAIPSFRMGQEPSIQMDIGRRNPRRCRSRANGLLRKIRTRAPRRQALGPSPAIRHRGAEQEGHSVERKLGQKLTERAIQVRNPRSGRW